MIIGEFSLPDTADLDSCPGYHRTIWEFWRSLTGLGGIAHDSDAVGNGRNGV